MAAMPKKKASEIHKILKFYMNIFHLPLTNS